MKYVDKFLNYLKTDRNTFATYILTLCTIYIVVDRFVELLFLFFTGISYSYWGPITYTFALACPVFAFLFSYASKFVTSSKIKLSFLYLYCSALYIIGISMAVQWINAFLWLALFSVPNYTEIVIKFADLIKPAFTAIALYLPLTTFYPLFDWLLTTVNDVKPIKDSIFDYPGLNINASKSVSGAYTCEMYLCKDKDSGKNIKIIENRRFESALVVGASGSGKTTMIFEPMIARDLERKYFFQEVSKEMGFTALKTGIATLTCPYTNDYINENFNLNMLTPVLGKEKLYKAYMKKLIYSDSDKIVYKNLGITAMTSDYESIMHMQEVAKNFNIKVNTIDPLNDDSIGLNPFAMEDPFKIAISISTLIHGMQGYAEVSSYVAFKSQLAEQSIENIAVLLKEMYPRLHNGTLPTLEDMLKMLNNFDMIEDMCHEMENDLELAEKYALQLAYFKKNFYKANRDTKAVDTTIASATAQLDSLLRVPNVRNVLCNRTSNVDFDKILDNGDVTFICTRRGDIGATGHKAFGLFVLLLMQTSVLRRAGTENTRIPHFLYVDEFADFINKATEPMFIQYRKYRVGSVVSIHNLDQLGIDTGSKYRETIVANTATKVIMGAVSPDDEAWWIKELGKKREWSFKFTYNTADTSYDSKFSDPQWAWKDNFEPGKLQSLEFKQCAYKIKVDSGRSGFGIGLLDFLDPKYKKAKESKFYDFSKFTKSINNVDSSNAKKKNNLDIKDDNGDEELDPIQMNNTDSKFLFDNEDAVVVNLKKDEKK